MARNKYNKIVEKEIVEEVKEIKEERLMLPSEFARENSKNFHDFLWWDTNIGKVNFEKYKEIEKQIYGGND